VASRLGPGLGLGHHSGSGAVGRPLRSMAPTQAFPGPGFEESEDLPLPAVVGVVGQRGHPPKRAFTRDLALVGLDPVPDLPVIVPVTGALTSTSTSAPTPSGGSSVGPAPGTGAPQHRALDRFSGPSARQTTSTGGGRGASSTSQAKGSPGRTPAPRTPSPSFPLAPSGAGTSLVPGHGTNLWNDVPALILILGALALGGVLLRRRIAPRLLFGSRFAPPG
jgi:hypothetical protein